MLKGIKQYAKKILYWSIFVITGIALYVLWIKYNTRTIQGANGNTKKLHDSDKRVKDYIDQSETNARNIKTRIKDAADDNSTALAIISGIERTNERFRVLLQEIQNNSDD